MNWSCAPLGGLGEIGMNCALDGFGPANKRKWLMVDLGVAFAGEESPGVDLILPDLRFVESIKKVWWGSSSRTPTKTTSARWWTCGRVLARASTSRASPPDCWRRAV